MSQKKVLLQSLFFMSAVFSPVCALAGGVVDREMLLKEANGTLFSLNAAYSMSGDGSIFEIKSPTLLACIRKQLADYRKSTDAFPGGTDAFATAIYEKKIRMKMFVYDFTRKKGDAVTALETSNLFPDPHVINESDQKAVNIIASIGIDPKSHSIVCRTQNSDDILTLLTKIPGLGFKTDSSRPAVSSPASIR